MSDYPKYQYSYFIGNGAQVVVRAENSVELSNAVTAMQALYPVEESKVASRPIVVPSNTTVNVPVIGSMCEIHNVPLKDRISKAGKPYKSHVRKVGEDWDRCFGKGYMSELEGQTIKEIGIKLGAKDLSEYQGEF